MRGGEVTQSRNYDSEQLFGRCIKALAAILGEDYGDTTETERWREHRMMTLLLDEMSNCLALFCHSPTTFAISGF
jgi:hypothetical protein